MHILVVAGVLAVAGAQNIDPSVLGDIFGTPPTNNPVTRQPLEDASSSTLPQDYLKALFGITPNGIEEVPRNTRLVKVNGLPTIKPSLLIEVFGTPPTPKFTRETHEDTTPKRVTQGSRNVNVAGVPTIKPSLLTEVFGTPSTNSSLQQLEDANSRGVNQDRGVPSVPTVKPSVLKEVFGTPPSPDTSGSRNGDKTPQGVDQGTRNVNVEGVPTVDPSIIIDIFGTPPTTTNSTKGFEEITVKPTEGTSTFTDKEGSKCQCVPYYLCDANNVGVDVYNSSITGAGMLDIRFGDDDNERKCQESVEVCCKIPDATSEPLDPKPPKPLPLPQPAKGCGYRNPQGLGVTVIGTGHESQFGEFPWVVALLVKHNFSYAGVGVLINPRVVMTGAHVIQKYGGAGLKIRAGEWDTQTVKEIYPFEERDVQDTVIHPNFMPKSLKNDIALMLLDRPFEITEHINVICMPDQEEVFDSSKNCVANGWGKMNFGQSNRYAVILKKVEVDMVPYNRCNQLLKRTRLGHNFKLHNSFVCAGGEAGKDTCQGDGGAPLACPIGNNRYKLTGLVAWGIGCGQQDVPAVYTNVPLFRDWVDDKMAEWGLAATSYRISED